MTSKEPVNGILQCWSILRQGRGEKRHKIEEMVQHSFQVMSQSMQGDVLVTWL